jgi:hypothetical protein
MSFDKAALPVLPSSEPGPAFPSLYWPVHASSPRYLTSTAESWRFTLLWTLLIHGATHLTSSLLAIILQPRKQRISAIWAVPLASLVIAAGEGILGGSITGLMLGAVYSSAGYRMSTWIPFIWGVINGLVLVLASFSIQGGL